MKLTAGGWNKLSLWSPMKNLFLLVNCTSTRYNKSDGQCACAFNLPGSRTWQQAFDDCKSNNARLPEVKSAAENADIFARKVTQISIIYLNK